MSSSSTTGEQLQPVITGVAYTEEDGADQQEQEQKKKNGGSTTLDRTSMTADETGMTTDDASANAFRTARTGWWGTSILLISDVMGTGVLGLPYVAATLGWASTMVALIVFAFFAAYAGHQLKAVRSVYPTIMSYSDAGTVLVGSSFGVFTQVCMLINWGALGIYFLIATANGIADIYDEGFLSCNVNRSWIAAVLLVVPAQSRDFHAISKYLAIPSMLAIIITILIVLISMLMGDTETNNNNNTNATIDDSSSFGDTTIIGVKEGTDAFDYLQSLSSIVFSFQGQSIFLELMNEMKQPQQFGKSVNSAYGIMFFWYASTVIIAYGVEGDTVTKFLPDILVDKSGASITAGVLGMYIKCCYKCMLCMYVPQIKQNLLVC